MFNEHLNGVGNPHNDPVHLWQLEYGRDSVKIGIEAILALPEMTEPDAVDHDLQFVPMHGLNPDHKIGWALHLEFIDRRKFFMMGGYRVVNPKFITDKNPFGYLWWQLELGLLFNGGSDDE